MADADDSVELLFFDTFSHEIHEDLNLDLVQFPQPVYITEVRIIPLGARVQADFPGGVRLGATNPSKFHIDFFVNDLAKTGASTFERLGNFDYNQNDCINLQCATCTDHTTGDRQIPTDGLVLRGSYTAITLAVYGSFAKSIGEAPLSSPPAPLVTVEQLGDALAIQSQIVSSDGGGVGGGIGDMSMDVDKDITYASAIVGAQLTPGPPTTPQTPKDSARQYTENWVASTGAQVAARAAAKSPDLDAWDVDDDLNKDLTTISSPQESLRSPEFRRRRSYDRGVLDKKLLKTREYESASRRSPQRMPRTPSPEMMQSPTSRRPRTPDTQHPSKQKFYANSVQSPQSTTDADTDVPTAVTSAPNDSLPPIEPDDDVLSQGEAFEPILSDEEIGDDNFEPQYDIEYDDIEDTTMPPALIHFNPFVDELKQYVPTDAVMTANTKELIELATKCLHRSKLKEHLNVERSFIDSPSIEMKENWVHAAEQLIQIITLIYNLAGATRKRSQQALSTLISLNQHELVHWLKIGLSFDCANSQQQPGYKIRHIKCGIRLIELIAADESFIEYLVVREKFNIFNYLYRLYEQKFMALSIKLMICKAIYACLDTKTGIEYFTEATTADNDHIDDDAKLPLTNGYQKLIELLQANPLTRIKFALKSILKKVNLYESIQVIRDIVNRRLYADSIDDDAEMACDDQKLLKNLLHDVWAAHTWDMQNYTQPKRFLPISTKFETNTAISCGFFNTFFGIHGLLESLLLIVSNNSDAFVTEELFDATLLLIESLCRTSHGLDYLSEQIEVTNVLAKCLLQASAFVVDQEVDEMADVEMAEIADDTRMHRLGVELSYKMKTLYCLEAIADIMLSTEDREQKLVDHFHCLYSLTVADGYVGRKHVVDTIAMNDHIIVILKQIENEKKVIHEALTSAGAAKDTSINGELIETTKYVKGPILDYAIDLIDLTVRYADTNLQYIRQHGQILLSLVKSYDQFEAPISQTLQELTMYLKPLENPNIFSYENIFALCEIVKRNMEFINTFPGELILALRIIRYLTIPDMSAFDSFSDLADIVGDASAIERLAQSTNQLCEPQTELKYKYSLLQFYSNDGITILVSILDKVCACFEHPELHTATLGGSQGLAVAHLILPVTQILRKMLTYVIEARNTDYNDLTAIEPLLRTYMLMSYVPAQAMAADDAHTIQNEIVKTLMAYTQPTPAGGIDSESIHKTLWSQMISELFKFIGGPNTFMPMLSLLIRLLPIPLPLPTKRHLTSTEQSRIVTERKLWSAHLHMQSIQISEMIKTLCISSHPPLVDLVNRAIGQFADLAPNMSLLAIKTIAMDMLLADGSSSLPSTPVDTNGETSPALPNAQTIFTYINPQTKRVLNFLANILVYISVKAAFLSILPGKVYELFLKILAVKPVAIPSHMHSVLHQQHESTLAILHTLFNGDILLVDQKTTSADVALACSLPPKECMPGLIGAIIDAFLTMDDFGSQFNAIKSLVLLSEYEYTSFQLKLLLDKRKDSVLAKLRGIARPTDNDANAYEILSTFLLFIQSLMQPNALTKSERSFHWTESDLVKMLQYKRTHIDDDDNATGTTSNDSHPLSILKSYVTDRLADSSETLSIEAKTHLEEILLNTNNVLKLLDNGLASITAATNDNLQKSPAPEPNFAQTEILGIVDQYAQRCLYKIISDESAATNFAEQLTTTYWCPKISPCRFVDYDVQQTTHPHQQPGDTVPCDLIEMVKLCLPAETNLTSDCKRLLHLSASPQSHRERTTSAPCFRTRRVEVEPSTGRPEKKIYSRGRGFSRMPPSRSDLFRSRPPNTSRPPSLHVDDFLALETCGAQPTGPTGYNKLSREIINIRGTRGGRGRGRILSSTGSPFRHSSIRRTNSPSTWTNHSLSNINANNSGDGGSTQHFRTATAEPVHSTHFQSDYSSSHFSNSPSLRGRRGTMRPPRSFNRST